MATPYITADILNAAPTGINWSLIPEPQALVDAQRAEQTNVCWRATSMVDTDCHQVLRATVANEEISGPGNVSGRLGVQPGTGNGIAVMRAWPVTQVLAMQVSPNTAFPRAWSLIPAGQYAIEYPLLSLYTDSASATAPDGGSAILIKPGYVCRTTRRNSVRMLVSYINGWPHTSLIQNASAGDRDLRVDDVTGWTGANGFVYDGAATEQVSITAVDADNPLELPGFGGSAQTGPGTVTLSYPLAYDHLSGIMTSALPAAVQQGAIMAATIQALESGIEAITVETLPGSETLAGHGVGALKAEYAQLIAPFTRRM